MHVGSAAHEHIKGLTRIVSGLRAKYMPVRTLLCPTSRPPEPQHPVVNVFTEVVCDVGASPPRTATSPPPNGGICTI